MMMEIQKTIQKKTKNYRILRKKSEIESLVSNLLRSKEFCHDFETNSLETHIASFKVVGVAFSTDPKEVSYIPFNHPIEGIETQEEIVDLIRVPIENQYIGKIGQNIKYEYRVWNRLGVNLKGIVFDTMIASYCLFGDKVSHALDEMCLNHLGHIKIRTDDVLDNQIEEPVVDDGKKKKKPKKKKKSEKTMLNTPLEVVAEYCCEDVEYTLRLTHYFRYLMSLPENQSLKKLYYEQENPLIEVLAKMECSGVRIDSKYLERLKDEYLANITEIKARIDKIAGFEISITKTLQLAEVIYDKLELFTKNKIVPKKTKTGKRATNEKVLTKIAHEPFVKDLFEIKKFNKLVSTYIKPLPAKVSEITSNLHCDFVQHITTTSRLACRDPNLQNIPKKTVEGRAIRAAFISRFLNGLIGSYDYSQQELRILAHLAKEPVLVETYKKNGDAHIAAAAMVYSIPEEQVSPQQRYLCKTLQYAILYGAEKDRIAIEAKISVDEAEDLIKRYMNKMKGISDFIENTYDELMTFGYVETMFGFRRYLPKAYSLLRHNREAAKREAFNMKMQGAAAAQMKRAMISISKFLEDYRTLIEIQVHDELVIDFHPDELFLSDKIKELMETAVVFDVPMVAEGNIKENWMLAH